MTGRRRWTMPDTMFRPGRNARAFGEFAGFFRAARAAVALAPIGIMLLAWGLSWLTPPAQGGLGR